ncbi:hypothetical protein [Microscilla marina]|uniref:Uncharacterized protein n=1 Tax=Microscilla marina ATCC 23134 TaxID=313606 RepID=A1ZYX8_MICM2|nr:hypothetical protein [Microscilla marina]EAY24414.1 hypothetical protein M23134_01754 [Microscilla marina ATCC 23134]
MEKIKELKFFTKKIPLTFDSNGNSVNTLDIEQIKKEIGEVDIDYRSIAISQTDTHIMVTFRVASNKNENSKSIGFGG